VSRPIQVMHVVMDLEIGGGQASILTALQSHNPEAFNVTICCIGRAGALAKKAEQMGGSVLSLDRQRLKNDLGILWELMRLMRYRQIDVVHTHLYCRSNVYGRAAAALARVPVKVATEHGGIAVRTRKRWLADHVLERFTDGFIAVSRAVKENMVQQQGVPAHKIRVIHNGVDPYQFRVRESQTVARQALGLPVGIPVIGCIGRLELIKGHSYLVDAMIQIRARLPQAVLLVVGAGTAQAALREQVRKRGLSGVVLVVGGQQDIRPFLQAMDLFVLPSLDEGFGIALLEAMAMELPIVASNVGGIPEVVDNGKTGVLVSPRDSDALAQAIVALLKHEEKRHRMGMLGRERVLSRFTAQHSASQLEALYESLLRAKGIRLSA
jgi:glycosyltransferase involved in cell wall biosynthesis